MKKICILILVILVLSGCSHSVTPTYIEGRTYLIGDDNCRDYSQTYN